MKLSRTAILAVAVITACSTSPSARWEYVATDSDGARFYLDPSSVKVVGDHVEAFELADFKEDGSDWKSMKSRVQYRCTQGTAAWLDSQFYSENMGKGSIVSTRQEKDQSFKTPAPNTPSAQLNKKACSLAGFRA